MIKNNITFAIGLLLICLTSCKKSGEQVIKIANTPLPNSTYIQILGIAQDAGFPQANCKKACCEQAWKDQSLRRKVSCIAVVDPSDKKSWMIDATPDFKDQLFELSNRNESDLAGVFLTHAHVGHYTGLIHLGREIIGSEGIPVFAMPRMKSFLENNGPWSQLVSLNNISLMPLQNDSTIILNNRLKITPWQVPHRDEFSETVGFLIESVRRRAIFIPDIDKWEQWNTSILELIPTIDYALLDGSFYKNGEIVGRDMSEIPHPFIEESMKLFDSLPLKEKRKIYFTHFNHTNPVLDYTSDAYKYVTDAGYNIALENGVLEM